jgi:MoxR-like ATPase
VKNVQQPAERIVASVERVIVGKHMEVRMALVALLCEGHILIEDVPGVGKTMLAKAISQSIGCSFRRIQFTPDLLPSDVTGLSIYNQKTTEFEFRPGPIMAQVVLADEINRATPKTQSAMLEAMQEHSVTVAKTTRRLPEPFFVLATQNPLEMEGTYPLPEAQLDRFFFKIDVPFPSVDELVEIANRTTAVDVPQASPVADGARIVAMQKLARGVPIAEHVVAYAARLLKATHPDDPLSPPFVNEWVRYGASPRGMQAMILAGKIIALLDGRYNVAFDDIRTSALPALRHRMILNFEAQAEGITTDHVIARILDALVPEPA